MIASVLACMLLAAPALAADGSSMGGGGMYGDMGMDMDTNTGCNTTILEVGLAIPELSTLASFGITGGVMDPSADVTVLAPSNAAFEALNADTLAALRADPAMLGQILQLHLFLGGLLSTELTDGMVVATVGGGDLTVGVSDDGITFTAPSGAVTGVVQADFIACASVLHVVDTLLI